MSSTDSVRSSTPTPARVFISYSRHDKEYKDQLVSQLMVLERQGLLATWSDERIELGVDWHPELLTALNSASVVILLITVNFLTSEFILREEVPRALEQRRASGLKVVPVYCRPCAWEAVPWLARIQIWPRSAQPLWGNAGDDAASRLSELAREIARMVGTPIPGATKEEPIIPDEVERQIAELEALDLSAMFDGIVSVIKATIAVGAPIYNRGDKARCAAIYLNSVERMAALTEHLVGAVPALGHSAMPEAESALRREMAELSGRGKMPSSDDKGPNPLSDPLLLSASKWEFQAAARFGRSPDGCDPDALAWQVRRVFDRLLLFDAGARALGKLDTLVRLPGQGIMRILDYLDQIADLCGLESEDDYGVGMYTSASLALLACRTISVIGANADDGPTAGLAHRRLERAIFSEALTAESAARVLWRCASALRYLARTSGL